MRRLAPAVGLAAVVLLVDQLTKHWALQELQTRNIDLFWTLRLNLVFNEGTAFSLGGGMGWLFGPLALAVSVVLLRWAMRLRSLGARLAIGAIVGGALGNLLDRAFRAGDGFLGGRVVDFIDLQWWPVFNVADIGIVVGAIALVLIGLVRGDDAYATVDGPGASVDAEALPEQAEAAVGEAAVGEDGA
ncbi:MAG: signal peptidase II [Acidimicrobiales bacterium]|nr:signal peptidase II [Acidimicrobiales bacterium]